MADKPRLVLLPADNHIQAWVHLRHHMNESARTASVVGGPLAQAIHRVAGQPYRPGPVTEWGRQVQHAVTKDQGFTFHDHIGDGPKSGYMVSVAPEAEHVIPLRDLHPDHIADYRDTHQDLLKDPNNFLGGWVYKGKAYLDISRHVESRDQALALARQHNQLGVYDIGSGQTVLTNESGERPGQQAEEPQQVAASLHLLPEDNLSAVNALRAAEGLDRLPASIGETTSLLARSARKRAIE